MDEEKSAAETEYETILRDQGMTVTDKGIEQHGSLVHYVVTGTEQDGRVFEAKGDTRLNALRALNVMAKAK